MNAEHGDGDVRPRPDPTTLTTEALRRDIGALRELLEERINGLSRLTDERIFSIDKRLEWDELIASSFKGRVDKVEGFLNKARIAIVGISIVLLLVGFYIGTIAVRGGP